MLMTMTMTYELINYCQLPVKSNPDWSGTGTGTNTNTNTYCTVTGYRLVVIIVPVPIRKKGERSFSGEFKTLRK